MPQTNKAFLQTPTKLRKVKKDNTPTYFKKFYNEGGNPYKI